MELTLWSFVPLVAAPAFAIAAIWLLRRLMRLPTISAAAQTATSTTSKEDLPAAQESHVDAIWAGITAYWNPWFTWVLPVVVGAAIIVLVAWPCAYLGWAVMWAAGDPTSQHIAPPWFGNFGYLLAYGLFGALAGVLGLLVGLLAVLGLHWMGKCIIWPEACGCEDGQVDAKAGDE